LPVSKSIGLLPVGCAKKVETPCATAVGGMKGELCLYPEIMDIEPQSCDGDGVSSLNSIEEREALDMLVEGGLQAGELETRLEQAGEEVVAKDSKPLALERAAVDDGGKDSDGDSKLVVLVPVKAEPELSVVQDAHGQTVESPNACIETFARDDVEKGQLDVLPEDDDMISDYFGPARVDILSCGSPDEPASDDATQLDSVAVFGETFLPPPEGGVARSISGEAALLQSLGSDGVPGSRASDGEKGGDGQGHVRGSCKSVSEIFLDMPEDEWNLLDEKDGPLAEAVMSWNNLLEDGFTLVDNSTLRMAAKELKKGVGEEEGEKSTSLENQLEQPSCTSDSGLGIKPLDHTSPPLQMSSTMGGISATAEPPKDGKLYRVDERVVVVRSKRTPEALVGREGTVKDCNASGWYTVELISGDTHRLQACSLQKYGPAGREEMEKKLSADMATSPTRALSASKKRARDLAEEEANPYRKVYAKASRRRGEAAVPDGVPVAKEPVAKHSSRGARVSVKQGMKVCKDADTLHGARGKHGSALNQRTSLGRRASHPVPEERTQNVVAFLRHEMNRFEECVPWGCCHASWKKIRLGWRKRVRTCVGVSEAAELLKELCATLARGRQPKTPDACGEWDETLADLGDPKTCSVHKLITLWAKVHNLGCDQSMIPEDLEKAKEISKLAGEVENSELPGLSSVRTVMAAVKAATISGDANLLESSIELLPVGSSLAVDAIKGALLAEQMKCEDQLEKLKACLDAGKPAEWDGQEKELAKVEGCQRIVSMAQDGELDLSMEWEEHLELDFLDEDVHFMCDRTFLSNDQYLTDVED